MRIGIDARLYGPKHTGIGRYVKNLIDHLLELDHQNMYVLFGNPQDLEIYKQYKNVQIVKFTPRVYTLAEQFLGPFVFSLAKLDLLHVPHINAPIFYFGNLNLTVHDLIKHLSTGKQTTTLPKWQYSLKHLFYRLSVYLNVHKARNIITPTQYWKNELINRYRLNPSKIHVTYEGVDWHFSAADKSDSKKLLKKYNLQKPFVIYTGNLYPHKNVDLLIKAVNHFNSTHDHKLTLALICGRSVFHQRISESEFIKPLGFVPDEDMSDIYSEALALVQPSLIEGFGLTGLEAMAVGLPVVSSNASCLPEVYQDAALYFDPYDYQDLANKLEQIAIDKKLRETLITEGFNQVKLYSWKKMAKETLQVYKMVS
jgi:glycosyltransferase involved in cell wall biosynthesis